MLEPRAQPSKGAKELYTGVQVRNFLLQVDIEEVMELLEDNGLPKGMRENVKIFKKKRNSGVNIELLSAEVCHKMIENLEKNISIWDQKLLHCSGATTEDKDDNDNDKYNDNDNDNDNEVFLCRPTT